LLSAFGGVLFGGTMSEGSTSNLPRTEAEPAFGATLSPAGRGSHTILIMLENREYDEVVGAADAPFFNRMVAEGAVPTGYFALRHPSLPNYLALLGGSTFGIEEDCSNCSAGGPNLVTQIAAAGISWRAYMGAMPRPCFRGAEVGLYAKKHNPFMYFPSIVSNRALCENDVPEGQLRRDLVTDELPEFGWISPDLCDDAHSCEFGSADSYLAGLVPRLRQELGPRGLLVITFDEGTTDEGCCGASGGRIATILIGPEVRRGVKFGGSYTEYSLLATLEDRFGLPRLRAARSAPPLSAGFTKGL
jgi:phosphatidylinositol-3-phosphatase